MATTPSTNTHPTLLRAVYRSDAPSSMSAQRWATYNHITINGLHSWILKHHYSRKGFFFFFLRLWRLLRHRMWGSEIWPLSSLRQDARCASGILLCTVCEWLGARANTCTRRRACWCARAHMCPLEWRRDCVCVCVCDYMDVSVCMNVTIIFPLFFIQCGIMEPYPAWWRWHGQWRTSKWWRPYWWEGAWRDWTYDWWDQAHKNIKV